MAKKETKAKTGGTKPQTSAETEQTYTNAMDKIRDEMASSKDGQIQLLGEGLTALLQLHPEWEQPILAKGKTIKDALEAVRKNATGGCSDPIQTTKSLCGYYGIECKNPHALALEVTVQMMGGGAEVKGASSDNPSGPFGATSPYTGEARAAASDPFDLDALLASCEAGLSPSDPKDSPGETRDAKRGGAKSGVL